MKILCGGLMAAVFGMGLCAPAYSQTAGQHLRAMIYAYDGIEFKGTPWQKPGWQLTDMQGSIGDTAALTSAECASGNQESCERTAWVIWALINPISDLRAIRHNQIIINSR